MTDDSSADLRPANSSESSVEDPEHPKTLATSEDSSIAQNTPGISEESGVVQSAGKKSATNFSFTIWPPTQRTRDAIIQRLLDTLSSPSVLSKRYGVVPAEEASEAANRIEGEAFTAASASTLSPDDDGIEILQIYSKEISRRMIETVKSRSDSGLAATADTPKTPGADDVTSAGGKEAEDAVAKD